MTAAEHLSPDQFFHGTTHAFEIGQELTAGGAKRANPDYPSHIRHVWATSKPLAAAMHATRHGPEHWDNGHVYQVEPMNREDVEPDPLGHGWRSPSGFRVVRDMGSPAKLWNRSADREAGP